MAQVPANMFSAGGTIDYTPGSAVTGGDVVVLGSIVAVALTDIAAGELGSLCTTGIFKVPKITGANAIGTKLYWDPAGDPVGGTAGTGAATSTAGSLKLMGYVVAASLSADERVVVELSRA
jgi:predicted RecA/RadA family phage recombinase